MAIKWITSVNRGSKTVSIFSDNIENLSVPSSHPNYDDVIALLDEIAANDSIDEEQENDYEERISNLVDLVSRVGKRLTRLSERVTTDGSNIMFDGDVVDTSVSQYLLKALRSEGITPSGDDDSVDGYGGEKRDNVSWIGIVAFLEKLYQNPSQESISNLYEFIRRYNLVIRPDGDFIAFKGLRSDYASIHSGEGIVNGIAYDKANLDNSPGNVIEVRRSYVDSNQEEGCSRGLHAGSIGYASSFAQGQLVAVAINPRDVVSVPHDYAFQKIRTCRYEVLNDVAGDYEISDNEHIWYDEYSDDYYDCEEDCNPENCECERCDYCDSLKDSSGYCHDDDCCNNDCCDDEDCEDNECEYDETECSDSETCALDSDEDPFADAPDDEDDFPEEEVAEKHKNNTADLGEEMLKTASYFVGKAFDSIVRKVTDDYKENPDEDENK